jgi:hypothetical protein
MIDRKLKNNWRFINMAERTTKNDWVTWGRGHARSSTRSRPCWLDRDAAWTTWRGVNAGQASSDPHSRARESVARGVVVWARGRNRSHERASAGLGHLVQVMDQWVNSPRWCIVDNSAWYYEISKYLFTWIHMLISYSANERGSASSSPWVSLCRGTMGVERWWWMELQWCGALARDETK